MNEQRLHREVSNMKKTGYEIMHSPEHKKLWDMRRVILDGKARDIRHDIDIKSCVRVTRETQTYE